MSKIILPIRKQFSDLIFSGDKVFEYRKKLPKEIPQTVFVYESKGSGKIVGRFEVVTVWNLPLDELWEKTKTGGGISEEYFREYFDGFQKGLAIEIKSPELFDKPLGMEFFGFDPHLHPQNYCMVNELKPFKTRKK